MAPLYPGVFIGMSTLVLKPRVHVHPAGAPPALVRQAKTYGAQRPSCSTLLRFAGPTRLAVDTHCPGSPVTAPARLAISGTPTAGPPAPQIRPPGAHGSQAQPHPRALPLPLPLLRQRQRRLQHELQPCAPQGDTRGSGRGRRHEGGLSQGVLLRRPRRRRVPTCGRGGPPSGAAMPRATPGPSRCKARKGRVKLDCCQRVQQYETHGDIVDKQQQGSMGLASLRFTLTTVGAAPLPQAEAPSLGDRPTGRHQRDGHSRPRYATASLDMLLPLLAPLLLLLLLRLLRVEARCSLPQHLR